MRDRIDHDVVVQQIYDCADTPGGWKEVLSVIARSLAAEKGHIFIVNGGRVETSEFYGYDDPARIGGAYHQHFQRDDPRFTIGEANPGRVLCDADGAYEFRETAVYNDLLKAEDIRHSMYVQVPLDELVIAQAFMRPHAGVPFDPEDVRAYQQLQPHVCRAIKLGRTLDAMRAELSDLRLALNLLPIPVLLLDGRGVVLCTSSRADELLAGQKSLVITQQRLTATLPRHAKAIEAAVQKTVGYAEPTRIITSQLPPLPPPLEVEVGEHRTVKLSFMPLRPRHALRQHAEGKARVLVVLHAPDETVKLEPALIAQLHGLTRTESQLAAALAEGKTVTQYSAEKGCSEHTARVHLKHILEKTGTHRQAELVSKLMSSAALHLVNP